MRGSDRLDRTNLLSVVLLVGLAAAVWSSAASVSAQGGLPTRPAVHTIATLHQGFRVYWYESSEDGGSAITGYDVEYRSAGAEQWTDAGHTGTSHPELITGLRFNTSYELRVRARNANGAGPWSSVETRRTTRDDGKPDRPWPPTLEPGDGRIEVSWNAPAYTGGRPITGYHVRYTTDNAATWRTWAPGGKRLITGTTTTITGLDNGVTVGVAVGALNARGQGRYSSPFAETAPVPALTISLESSRQICTANTLTELSWTIRGGVPPYTLTVEGERVDPDSEKNRANCGPIASDPLTGDPVANPTKTFQARVMDARQFASTANEVVDLASPLHAPLNPFISGLVQTIRFGFDRVANAGGQWPTDYEPSVDADKLDPGYVLRTRPSGASASAPFQVRRLPAFTDEIEWSASGKHVGMIAAMRHPIEHHTPNALVWSEPVAFALARSPEQVTITATHDTVTISWAEQPQAQCVNITLDGPAYRDSRFVSEVSTHAGRHSYTFVRLTPGTEYDVTISVGCYTSDAHGPSHDVPRIAYYFGVASTTPAPPNWTAPAIGSQNRQATAIQADVLTQQRVLGGHGACRPGIRRRRPLPAHVALSGSPVAGQSPSVRH